MEGCEVVVTSSERKGATKHCAYGICNSDSRYMGRPGMEGVFFIRFPQFKRDPDKCTRWANACRRENFNAMSVKEDTYLEKFEKSRKRRLVRKHLPWSPEAKRPRNDDSLHEDVVTVEAATVDSTSDHDRIQAAEALLMFQNNQFHSVSGEQKEVMTQEPSSVCKISQDKETQTTSRCLTLKETLALKLENSDLKIKIDELEKPCTHSKAFSIEDVKNDDKKMKFYTGLTYGQFICLWRFLGPATTNLSRVCKQSERTSTNVRGPKRKLSPENELFLTLVRLRLGLLHTDLAYRFGVSVSTVHDITASWIQFLYLQFSRLKSSMFPSRKKIKKH